MRRFIDLTTRSKLMSTFALFTGLALILIALASWLLLSLTARQEKLYEDDVQTVILLERIDAEFPRARGVALEMAATGEGVDDGIARIDSIVRQVLVLMGEVEQKIADNPGLVPLFQEYRQLYESFVETRREQIFPALRQGNADEALSILTSVQDRRYDRINALAEQMIEIAQTDAQRAVEQANSRTFQGVAVFLVVGLIAVLLSVVLAIVLTRMITTPLHRIGGYAREIAAGNLLIDVVTEERRDEFGALDLDFARMVENLRELLQETLSGIGVLASSGNQIFAATSQMASGASETAASVNQTTATVEQVKQTAQLSTEKAGHVAEIAQKVVDDSQTGRTAVENAIDGMQEIKSQMEAVTGSIVRLSDLSQTIGEIISTVNDLAEQSKLLAVNAAIEAAKAGEHGKGFAVVAQEVRHLAGQSKQATAQVRSILGDIQKATSASVMATEQGTRAVEAGMRQSSQAGEAIRALAETVEEAATAALQISASSKEQLVGMDQIALAMQNIKTATEQHVSGTRQTEEASRKLQDLGSRLQELASRFRI